MNDTPSVTSIVERLLVALVNAQLHGAGHARVRDAAVDVAARVGEHCAARGTHTVLLGTAADQVIVDGRPILGASLFAKRLLQRIDARGSGGVEFDASVSTEDVVALVDVLARRGADRDLAAARADLASRGVASVRLLKPYGRAGSGGDGRDDDPDGVVAEDVRDDDRFTDRDALILHQSTVDLLQGLTIAACQGRELDVAQAHGVAERIVDGFDRDGGGAMHALAQYPEYDFFTFGHSIRVALVAVDVARRIGGAADLVYRVGAAGLLHDVGKALVRWDVLHKRGPLEPDERREMQRHPVLGAGVLLANKTSDPLAVAAAYGHHCAAAASGYPRSCGEFEQGIVTRLVKLCDVYEALTAVRPYKKPMTPARAYRTMLSMKGHFDEDLLAHFIVAVGVYPTGSRVRLDDGSIARVAAQSAVLSRPIVDVMEEDGGVVPLRERRRIDLTLPSPGGPSAITQTLAAQDAARMLA